MKSRYRPDEPLRNVMGGLYARHKIENEVVNRVSREQKMQQNREVEINVAKLKKIRADRAMSQENLSLRADLHRAELSKIEMKGERARIRKTTAERIARALGCKLSDLLN